MISGQITRGNPQNLATPWETGKSGNPGGRPKGIGQFLRDNTRQGEELGAWFLDLWRLTGEFAERRNIPLSIRMEAANWIADRAFGKAVQQADVAVSGSLAVVYAPMISQEGSVEAEVREIINEAPESLINEASDVPNNLNKGSDQDG